jgi:IS30 family transposase
MIRGIPNRIDIDQRSDAVNNREVFGHWEADTIIGKTKIINKFNAKYNPLFK